MVMRKIYTGGKREAYVEVVDFEINAILPMDKFISVAYRPANAKSTAEKRLIVLDPNQYDAIELWNDTLRECVKIVTPEGVIK